LRFLDDGGMGVVYLARQQNLDRPVALKMIRDRLVRLEDLARFHTEARAVADLEHANVVRIYDFGECDGLPFFSMELLTGGSLAHNRAGKPLLPKEAAALVEKLARAVQAAHEKHIIHRDIKPGNVLLTEDGTPKLADFGLAKRLDQRGPSVTGDLLGTPPY